MTECSKCGDCCRAIRIAVSKDEMRAWPVPSEDAIFILEHWHEIPEEEAEHRIPGITGENSHGNMGNYFECDAFDTETNLCGAHENRPPVCKGFPWYGLKPNAENLRIFKQCSFWLDIKEGVEVSS